MGQKSKRSLSSAKSRAKRRKFPPNSNLPAPKSSAHIGKRNNVSKSVLTGPHKKRGPKEKIRASEIVNRAYDLKLTFEITRKQFDWKTFLAAQSKQEVVSAFATMGEDYRKKFLHRHELIFQCLKDAKFPKRDLEAREQFIADSLAGDGRVSIRRSRDICQEERARRKRQGTILRREFYIECSCSYEGPAFRDACPDCGAEVSYLDFASSFAIPAYGKRAI
jgi:hypothetical protein